MIFHFLCGPLEVKDAHKSKADANQKDGFACTDLNSASVAQAVGALRLRSFRTSVSS